MLKMEVQHLPISFSKIIGLQKQAVAGMEILPVFKILLMCYLIIICLVVLAVAQEMFAKEVLVFLTFTNNIFVRRDAANGISNSTFTNNLTFGAGNNAPWNANGNINTAGNIEDTDPQMTTSVAGGVVNPTSDFSIAAGPANNAATGWQRFRAAVRCYWKPQLGKLPQ